MARIAYERARRADTTHAHDYVGSYVSDLASVVDMEVIRGAGLKIGVDPLGGAGVAYWGPIAERYGIDVEVVNDVVDPTFRFMPLDWDGKIRMDCSSPYAMANLVAMKDRFDIAFGNDTDFDRHGIVTPGVGLTNPNHYLAAAIFYLVGYRPGWRTDAAVGKTIVSSSIIDRVAAKLGRTLVEVPVGFKWFVPGLLEGSLGSAARKARVLRFCAATAQHGNRQGRHHHGLAGCGTDGAYRARSIRSLPIPHGRARRSGLSARRCGGHGRTEGSSLKLSPKDVEASDLAGDPIQTMLTTAPGNGAAIGGLKVITAHGWFAARPSGTEAVYKLYAESFRSGEHLRRIQEQAQTLVSDALAGVMG